MIAQDDPGFQKAFFKSFTVVAIAELFDKTWFVAFMMALRYDKSIVTIGCFSALAIHAFLAAIVGEGLSRYFHVSSLCFATAFIYALIAGFYACEVMHAKDDDIMEVGTREVEEEVERLLPEQARGSSGSSSSNPQAEENPQAGYGQCEHPSSAGSQPAARPNPFTILLQIFGGVFIAECGDRTQIAIVSVSTSHQFAPVVMGALLAFLLLTISAVVAGSVVQGKLRVSERSAKFVAAISFAVFACLALRDGIAAKSLKENAGLAFLGIPISFFSGGSGR